MCLSKKEKEFVEDWLKHIEGEISFMEFVEKWKSHGKDWKTYIRVMRHRIEKKYEVMLKDLTLMKRFLELNHQP